MTAIAAPKKGSKFGLLAVPFKVGPKVLSVLAKLGKTAKFGKIALAGASFGTYAVLLSWKFALVLMASLLIHEYGHIWAMRRCGLKTKGVYFIPFLGAAAVTEDQFPSRRAESYIALMGPVWGFLLALATYGLYLATGEVLCAALAGWMAMLNLFNLLPINPLDGGRVLKSIAYSISSRLGLWFLVLGLGGAFLVCLKLNLGLLVLLLPIGALELAGEIKDIRRDRDRKRIVAALARELGTAATPEAVVRGIEERTETVKTAARLAARQKILARPEAYDDRRFAALVVDNSVRACLGELADRWQAIAVSNRRPYLTLIRRREAYAVTVADLRLFGHELTDGCGEPATKADGLRKFLQQKVKPEMTGGQTVASLAGYLGLGALLLALMFAASHVEAAKAALQMFMD